MTTPTPSPITPRPRIRQLPPWVSLLIVAACVAGAGWWVWSEYVSANRPLQPVVVKDAPTFPRGGRFGVPLVALNGVAKTGRDAWRATSGQFLLNVSKGR